MLAPRILRAIVGAAIVGVAAAATMLILIAPELLRADATLVVRTFAWAILTQLPVTAAAVVGIVVGGAIGFIAPAK